MRSSRHQQPILNSPAPLRQLQLNQEQNAVMMQARGVANAMFRISSRFCFECCFPLTSARSGSPRLARHEGGRAVTTACRRLTSPSPG
jgi:hypothetical protein